MSDITGNLYAFLIDSNSYLKPGTIIEPGVSLTNCWYKIVTNLKLFRLC